MTRSALDKLVSIAGIVIVIGLVFASLGLFWTHNFIHGQIHDQLASEKIFFPAAGSKGLTSLPEVDQARVSQYAGEQLLTGAQAEVFANNYIAVHLDKIGGGKTYSELSSQSLTDPTNTALAGQVETVFRGETLRGMLLNAYAFDTAALVAYYAAVGAGISAVLLFILSMLGFRHAAKSRKSKR